MIRVRSAVDEILKKIKGIKKKRETKTKKTMKKASNRFHTILSFYSLKNVYYIIQCSCVALLSLFFAFAPLLTLCFFLSFVTTKEKLYYSQMCYWQPSLFRVSNCASSALSIVWKYAFVSTESDAVIVVFLTKIFVYLLSLLKDFY